MAVSTSYAALGYSGNGSTTAFAVTWPFFDADDLIVTLVSSAGVETVQTLTTHYSVTGGTDADGLPDTGTVTMVTAPASGETLRIERQTDKTQASAWAKNGPFNAKSLEAALDRAILIAQELILLSPFVGEWAADTTYAVGDVVTNDGSTYIATSAHTAAAATEPGTGASWTTVWSIYVAKGSAGDDGTDGTTFAWRGAWATATSYALNDMAENDGSTYICTVAHTSGSTTEPGTGAAWDTVWDLLAEAGSVLGDTSTLLEKSANLSDVASATAARTNLGLGASSSVTFGDVTVGSSGTAAELQLGGASTGNTEGGALLLDNADDYDDDGGTARLYWYVRSEAGIFQIGLHNKATEDLRIGQDGVLSLGWLTGDVRIGRDDVIRGIVRVFGSSGGDGGIVRVHQGATEDGTQEYFEWVADAGEAVLQNQTAVGIKMKTDGTLTFPQHTSGVLEVDGSGNVSVGSGTGWTQHADGEIDLSSSTSGNTFGSIPAGTTEILILGENVTCGSSSYAVVTIGDSGGLEVSGYDSSASNHATYTSSTTAFIGQHTGSTNSVDYIFRLFHSGSNKWFCELVSGSSGTTNGIGVKTTSAELTQVAFAPASGVFSAGTIRLFYK